MFQPVYRNLTLMAATALAAACCGAQDAGVVSVAAGASAVHRYSQVETRASHLGASALGLGTNINMSEYLHQYPSSGTSILHYLVLDSNDVRTVISNIRSQATIDAFRRREFSPQIALELRGLSLAEFCRELGRPGSQVDNSIRRLAREIANCREQNRSFFIRPFSEMNDGTDTSPWEFGCTTRRNTPEDLAAAWKLLRDAFDQEGATNAMFVFSPLAAYSVHHEAEVLHALNLIAPGYIDAFGLNVYSRPLSAYGGASDAPLTFRALADPWLKLLARSRHKGIPLAVPEMGISNQTSDARRAAWLRDAFAYTREHRFVMVTYFNFPNSKYWQVDEDSLAGEALHNGVEYDRLLALNGRPLQPGIGATSSSLSRGTGANATTSRSRAAQSSDGLVEVHICSDSHDRAHSGCTVYTVKRVARNVASGLRMCHVHARVPGERN